MQSTKEECNGSFTISYEQGYLIRGIAMLMIFCVHSMNEYDVFQSFACKALMIPRYGVLGCSAFFFLSGYSMFYSLKRKGASLGYLVSHYKTLFIPYLVAFVLCLLAILVTGHSRDTFDMGNILYLSMPDGVDLWFFKAVLINYAVIVGVFMLNITDGKKVLVLNILYLLALPVFFVLHLPGHWYFSIMAFPVGVLFARHTFSPSAKKAVAALSALCFLAYYGFTVFVHSNTLAEIVGNASFAILMALIAVRFVKKAGGRIASFLIYIGKNSLYFYLFGVPVILFLDSSLVHWSVYFILNVAVTFGIVFAYKKCQIALTSIGE